MSSNRKVILFNNIWPTAQHPNEGTYAKTIAEVLEKAGADVEVCAMHRHKYKLIDYLSFYGKLAIISLPKNAILYINHYVFLFPLMFRLFFIHRRCIYHWHGEELIANGSIIRFLRWIMRKTFCPDDIHISPSQYYVGVIHKSLGVPMEQIRVSPSGGVDTDIFSGNPLSLEKDGIVHIGYSTALSYHKGMQSLMDLIRDKDTLEARIGHKVHFHIIEYGKEQEIFKSFVRTKQIDCITLYPKFRKNDLPSFYRHIHLLLFLSKRESLGLTALESMFCAVPVLGKNVCSMPEMIQTGITGELVSIHPSTEELIDKLALMVTRLSTYKPRDFVIAQYSQEKVANDYKRVFQDYKDLSFT
jgi:glycosyltransferase involved in cell wall biosynthesis